MENYLDQLNEQQRAAVEYCDGPSLVIAGAGSGKTRVLTYKIMHLLASGYRPWEIMALTFTNKAAREMKERVAAVAGEETASRLVMGTFHSVFLRILRRHADLLGYRNSFTIYDTADSKSLIKMIVKEMGLDEKAYKPNTLLSVISNAKNSLISPRQYIADKDNYRDDLNAKRPMTGEIYLKYTERCRMADAMDFDDILFNMNLLLRDHEEIAFEYGRRFKFVLVDEYQDTNFAQHLIISRLVESHRRLCVVGDDAQSIYSFRGANIDNILTLNKRFPELRTFKLERNYRSTQNIVNAAGSLISKNRHQIRKEVFSENEEGERVELIRAYSDIEEAYLVASTITRLRHTHRDSYDDYAVLYRTNAQSRLIEEALRKRDIPYRVYGGLAFYQRKEVKDAICYFRLAVNPNDDEALKRVINYPARGIGDTTKAKLSSAAIEGGKSIWEVLLDPAASGVAVNSGTARKLAEFRELIKRFNAVQAAENAYDAGLKIMTESGLVSVLAHENTPEAISRQENLEQVLSALRQFVDDAAESGSDAVRLSDYLSTVSLLTDQDEEESAQTPKVTLMTVHASKGLEFKHVLVTGLEDGLFPSESAYRDFSAIEEERRLLYVAITRAETTCTITYASTRMRNGKTTSMQPSRFLMDLDRSYITAGTVQVTDRPKPANGQYGQYGHWLRRSNEPKPAAPVPAAPAAPAPAQSVAITDCCATVHTAAEVSVGTRIAHPKFGKGEIVDVSDTQDTMITVRFELTGTKKLLLRFAKFEILTSE